MTLVYAVVMGIVEGLTEFLPVSSTAHLLLGERLLGFHDPDGVFTVLIQLGSILAIMWLYRAKIVDVVATLRKGDQSMAKTIVSNVKVQYIQRQKTGFSSRAGQSSSIDNGPIKTVTLIVTPKQAATVDWANNNGAKPRLVLRGNLDTTTADDTVTENEILGLPDAPPKPENDSTNKGADDATFAGRGR